MSTLVDLPTLIRLYPRIGSAGMAKRFGGHTNSYLRRAKRHNIRFGESGQNIPLIDLAKATGRSRHSLHDLAKQAGVLRYRTNGKRKLAVVPVGWASQVLDGHNTTERLREAREAGFLTPDEAAGQIGCTGQTVKNGLAGRGRLALLRSARTVRGSARSGPYAVTLLNPFDVEKARQVWLTRRTG